MVQKQEVRKPDFTDFNKWRFVLIIQPEPRGHTYSCCMSDMTRQYRVIQY